MQAQAVGVALLIMSLDEKNNPTSQAQMCSFMKACGYFPIALGTSIVSWITLRQLDGGAAFAVLALGILPYLTMFFALRKASTIPLCVSGILVSAVLIFGGWHVLFDVFFIHQSSLNGVFLILVPVVQLLVAVCFLTVVLLRTRKKSDSTLEQS